MSLLVHKGTMVRSKQRPSTRRPGLGTQVRGVVNPGLVPEEAPRRESTQISASSSQSTQNLLQTAEEQRKLSRNWEADSKDSVETSYGSIFIQLQEASQDSTGSCDFLRRTFFIVRSSLIVTMCLGLFLALPIAMMSIGTGYMGECPKEQKIPIYLLVGGSLSLIKLLLLIWNQIKVRRYERLGEFDEDEENVDQVMSRSARFTNQALSVFLFIWFILGNYWVISLWQPNYKQPLYDPNNWCHPVVYLFAFYQILTVYSIVALIALLTLSLITCSKCARLCASDNNEEAA